MPVFSACIVELFNLFKLAGSTSFFLSGSYSYFADPQHDAGDMVRFKSLLLHAGRLFLPLNVITLCLLD
jgi:hypothetical protein